MTDPGETPDTRDSTRRLEEILAEHRPPDAPRDEDPAGAASPDTARDGLSGIAEIERIGEVESQEQQPGGENAAEDGEPEDALPDAPLFALLRTIEREIGVQRIDRIWIFPPRRLQAGETSVVVVAAFPEIDEDRRRVYAAHYTAHDESEDPRLALDEYGTAPTERVGRLVEEVVERLKDEPAGAPRSHDIAGRDERWNTVLHQLAEAFLDETRRNPRLRP